MIEGLHTKSREDHHREHTIKRLEERWDIVISHREYNQLCQVVRRGDAFLVRKLSKDASVFLIAIENHSDCYHCEDEGEDTSDERDELCRIRIVPVVYSHLSQRISTAWPKESLTRLSKHYQESLYIRHRLKHHLPKILQK